MFFQDAERQQARPLRAVDGFNEIRRRKLFPAGRELRLRMSKRCGELEEKKNEKGGES
jgi:hypothetical protein